MQYLTLRLQQKRTIPFLLRLHHGGRELYELYDNRPLPEPEPETEETTEEVAGE